MFTPSTSELIGTIQIDVHYYEDGNVRLLTMKPFQASLSNGSAADIVKSITGAERKYQEELNRAFGALSEGAFKSLRRQLPITRQKIDWDKIGSYRLGQGKFPFPTCRNELILGRHWWRESYSEVRCGNGPCSIFLEMNAIGSRANARDFQHGGFKYCHNGKGPGVWGSVPRWRLQNNEHDMSLNENRVTDGAELKQTVV